MENIPDTQPVKARQYVKPPRWFSLKACHYCGPAPLKGPADWKCAQCGCLCNYRAAEKPTNRFCTYCEFKLGYNLEGKWPYSFCEDCGHPFGDGLAVGAWVDCSEHDVRYCSWCDLMRTCNGNLAAIFTRVAQKWLPAARFHVGLKLQLGHPYRETVIAAADSFWADRLIVESLKHRRFNDREPGVVFLRIAKEVVAAASIEEGEIDRLAASDGVEARGDVIS
jgi:hypothetical protein